MYLAQSSWHKRFLVFAVWLLTFGAAVHAQSTGTIAGQITDPSRASVPGATVTARDQNTGFQRSAITTENGNYQIVSLPIGTYRVEVQAPGFKTKVVSDVKVEVAQVAIMNLELEVGNLKETVTVQAAPPVIETAGMTIGQVINDKAVQEIPLNGRHFVDLGLLLPGSVVAPQNGFLTAPIRGQGALAFNTAGSREDTVNFMINGINLNDMVQNQITFQPTISTVAEFKSSNSTFSAEYGRNSGAIVTIATKTGGNQFHGEVFEYIRNEKLDAKNFFDNPNRPIPPFKRNQFGGSVGGPIVKDHTFFFFSYEGLRQRQAVPLNTIVPTTAQRTDVTDPTAQKLLQYIPPANLGTSSYVGAVSAPVNIDQWTIDISHKLGTDDNLHSYYALQKDLRNEPTLQGNNVPGFGDTRQARRQVFTLGETHIFGPNIVNDFRFGFNRIYITFLPVATINPTSVGINGGVTTDLGLPQISVVGMVNLGGPAGFPQGRGDTVLVWGDTLSYMKGKHSFKFGTEVRRFDNNNFAQDVGTMTFTNWTNFAAGKADTYQITLGGVQTGIRTTGFGLFAQDSYKVRPNLTLELGLRWDLNTTPTEVNNKLVVFSPATASLVRVGTGGIDSIYETNYRYFGPRVGFAWDPFHDGRISIRGGFGLFYDQPVTNSVTPLGSNPPFGVPSRATATSTVPVSISNPLATASAAATLAPTTISPYFQNSAIESWNLNIGREIAKDLGIQIGYFGSKGSHLRMARNFNQPVNGVRPYSLFSNIPMVDSGGNSSYNALWLSMNKRFSSGLQFNASYSLSHSIDYNSLSNNAVGSQDSYNLHNERGSSDFDARHNFHVSYNYDLPFKGNRLLEGWGISGVTTFQSGNPLTIIVSGAGPTGYATRRANLVGDPTIANPDPAMWFNAAAFCAPGTTGRTGPTVFGNVGRNTLVGPGFSNFDFSILKKTKVTENTKIEFRTEIFDLFNHPNFGQPGRVVAANNFGKILSTRFSPGDSGSARQIQFAVKYIF